MPSLPWRFSRCCAALLALLISAVGGFRAVVDLAPTSRSAAVAVVRDIGAAPAASLATTVAWRTPACVGTADRHAVAGTPSRDHRAIPAPSLLCGSALGPRAP